MLRWAVEVCQGPVAIRYPRGGEGAYTQSAWDGRQQVAVHRRGRDVTLLSYGGLINNVMQAAQILAAQGIEATVLRLLTVSALPSEEVAQKLSENPVLILAEEVCGGSGVREALAWDLARLRPACRVEGIDLGHRFVPHGAQSSLYQFCGLDKDSIAAYTKEVLGR